MTRLTDHARTLHAAAEEAAIIHSAFEEAAEMLHRLSVGTCDKEDAAHLLNEFRRRKLLPQQLRSTRWSAVLHADKAPGAYAQNRWDANKELRSDIVRIINGRCDVMNSADITNVPLIGILMSLIIASQPTMPGIAHHQTRAMLEQVMDEASR